MKDIIKGAITMIIVIGLAGIFFVEVRSNQLVKIASIAISLFIFPLTFPWPRWWFGGILVITTCCCVLWGHYFYVSMQPYYKAGPGGGLGVLFGLMWTLIFLAGVITKISFRLLLCLRNKKIAQQLIQADANKLG